MSSGILKKYEKKDKNDMKIATYFYVAKMYFDKKSSVFRSIFLCFQ